MYKGKLPLVERLWISDVRSEGVVVDVDAWDVLGLCRRPCCCAHFCLRLVFSAFEKVETLF